MNPAIVTWEGEGGAPAASKGSKSARHHGTLWIGVLYAVAIVAILAVVAKLN